MSRSKLLMCWQAIRLFSIATWFAALQRFAYKLDPEQILSFRLAQLAGKKVLGHFRLSARVEGIEHIEGLSNYCVVANHASFLDWALILGHFPTPVRFIARRELGRLPGIGAHLRRHAILIDREGGRKALKVLTQAIKDPQPWPIMLFPEGTRSEDGQIQRFRQGALKTMANHGVKLLPVVLLGSHDALPKGYNPICTDRRLGMVIGPPVCTRQDPNAAVQEVERSIRTLYQEHSQDYKAQSS